MKNKHLVRTIIILSKKKLHRMLIQLLVITITNKIIMTSSHSSINPINFFSLSSQNCHIYPIQTLISKFKLLQYSKMSSDGTLSYIKYKLIQNNLSLRTIKYNHFLILVQLKFQSIYMIIIIHNKSQY